MTDIEEYQRDAAEIRARHAEERADLEKQQKLDELRPLVQLLVWEELIKILDARDAAR